MLSDRGREPSSRVRHWVFVCLIAPSLVLAGCGASRLGDVRHGLLPLATPTVVFWSPVIPGNRVIPAPYVCADKIWLPLRWGVLPADTGELAIYFASYGPPLTSSREVTLRKMVAAWVVVGLRPTTHLLSVGRVPKGAVSLTDSKLPMCPPTSKDQRIDVMLFALPSAHRLELHSLAGTSLPDLVRSIRRDATVWGEFDAAYN